MTFRAAGRLVWFAWEAAVIIINYWFTAAFAPEETRRRARAAWLSRSSAPASENLRLHGGHFR